MLGYKNRGSRANFINRHRVRVGLRSQDPAAAESVLVLCGGAVAGHVAESELLARYARYECGYAGPLRVEAESATTWENIRNAIPLFEHADTIKIVSTSLHAENGRAHLWSLRPDLAQRLVRADEYRFAEAILIKPIAAAIGLWKRRA